MHFNTLSFHSLILHYQYTCCYLHAAKLILHQTSHTKLRAKTVSTAIKPTDTTVNSLINIVKDNSLTESLTEALHMSYQPLSRSTVMIKIHQHDETKF